MIVDTYLLEEGVFGGMLPVIFFNLQFEVYYECIFPCFFKNISFSYSNNDIAVMPLPRGFRGIAPRNLLK